MAFAAPSTSGPILLLSLSLFSLSLGFLLLLSLCLFSLQLSFLLVKEFFLLRTLLTQRRLALSSTMGCTFGCRKSNLTLLCWSSSRRLKANSENICHQRIPLAVSIFLLHWTMQSKACCLWTPCKLHWRIWNIQYPSISQYPRSRLCRLLSSGSKIGLGSGTRGCTTGWNARHSSLRAI